MSDAPTSPRAPAAAETAEREVERRSLPQILADYDPLRFAFSKVIDELPHNDGLHSDKITFAIERVTERFVEALSAAGATWQREQSALSGGERKEVLAVLEPFEKAAAQVAIGHPSGIFLNHLDAAARLAARLRSAPSEAALNEGPAGTFLGAAGRVWSEAAPSPAPEQEAKTAAEQTLALKRHIVRGNLEAIIVRCTEGDRNSDWLPIIHRLAEEALRYLPEVLSALPHPAPAADTVAVAAEIARLLGETP